MDYQEILVFVALGFALGYLFKTFFGKKSDNGNCGNGNCGRK
jgi:hypothetical protein